MNENVNLATENVAENVEVTTEQTQAQPEKVYTEEDFNKKLDEVLGKKIARNTAKIRQGLSAF